MYVRLLFQFKINELTHCACPIDPNQKGLLTIKTFVPSVLSDEKISRGPFLITIN